MARTRVTATGQRLERVGAGFRRFFGVALERQTYLNLAYLLLAFPLGLAYFVFVTVGLSVGLSLAIILVGIPILAVFFVCALGLAGFERWLTTRMLEVDIVPRTTLFGERRRDQALSLLIHRKTWTSILYLPLKFVIGLASFVIAVTSFSTAFGLLVLPLYYDREGLYVGLVSDRAPEVHQTLYLGWNYLLVGVEAVVTLGHWQITTLPQALVAAGVGVFLLFLTFHALNLLARLTGWFAGVMLEDGYDPLQVVLRGVKDP